MKQKIKVIKKGVVNDIKQAKTEPESEQQQQQQQAKESGRTVKQTVESWINDFRINQAKRYEIENQIFFGV